LRTVEDVAVQARHAIKHQVFPVHVLNKNLLNKSVQHLVVQLDQEVRLTQIVALEVDFPVINQERITAVMGMQQLHLVTGLVTTTQTQNPVQLLIKLINMYVEAKILDHAVYM